MNTVLPPLLDQVFQTGHTFDKEGKEHELHSNVSKEEALSLARAVQRIQPEATVEVGFAQGVSCLAILGALAANNRGTHHVIDPFQDRFNDIGLAMVERANLSSRLRFYRQFPEEVIPTLPAVQFAFVDASHLFDLTLMEFILIDKKLEVGGLIGFHDLWMPSLQKLTRYILANRNYELVDDAGEPIRRRPSWRSFFNCLPKSQTVFATEFPEPWQCFNAGNMIFLKKRGVDQRDWREHNRF